MCLLKIQTIKYFLLLKKKIFTVEKNFSVQIVTTDFKVKFLDCLFKDLGEIVWWSEEWNFFPVISEEFIGSQHF